MDKRLAIECLNYLEDIHFSEVTEDTNTIGYIDDNNRHIKVLFLENPVGKYLALAYSVDKGENPNKAIEYLSRWVINSRFELCSDVFILSSIFPILDESFLHKQINHALKEIWDMTTIIKNTPK